MANSAQLEISNARTQFQPGTSREAIPGHSKLIQYIQWTFPLLAILIQISRLWISASSNFEVQNRSSSNEDFQFLNLDFI